MIESLKEFTVPPVRLPKTPEEAATREKRRKELNELMSKHNINVKELALKSQISNTSLFGYRNGKYAITDHKWDLIQVAIKRIIQDQKEAERNKAKKKDKPYEGIVPEYVVRSLTNYGNTIVLKKTVKNIEKEYLKELKRLGFICRFVDTGDNHMVIEEKWRWTKA